MFSFIRPTFAAIALLAGIGLANAQTTQEHDAHHPAPRAPAPTPPPTSAAGMAMSKMMGGNMEQMMPMMRGMLGSMPSGRPATVPVKSDAIEAMITARLDAMKMTAASGKFLYALLADTQKKPADDLRMSPMGGM